MRSYPSLHPFVTHRLHSLGQMARAVGGHPEGRLPPIPGQVPAPDEVGVGIGSRYSSPPFGGGTWETTPVTCTIDKGPGSSAGSRMCAFLLPHKDRGWQELSSSASSVRRISKPPGWRGKMTEQPAVTPSMSSSRALGVPVSSWAIYLPASLPPSSGHHLYFIHSTNNS